MKAAIKVLDIEINSLLEEHDRISKAEISQSSRFSQEGALALGLIKLEISELEDAKRILIEFST